MKKENKRKEVDIAKAVRDLRHQLGNISQWSLGLKLGIQTAMISHWETRVQRVSHRNLWKMAMMAATSARTPLYLEFIEADGITVDDIRVIANLLPKEKKKKKR